MNDNFELDKNLYELLQKGSLEVITLINLGGISSIELYECLDFQVDHRNQIQYN